MIWVPFLIELLCHICSPLMDSFADLIRKAQRGDIAALRELVESYDSLIKLECTAFGLWQFPEWSHSDLSQEVAMRVLTRLDQFRGAESNNPQAKFKGWLRQITRSTILNILRRQGNTFNSPGKPLESLVEELYFADDRNVPTASSIVSRQEQHQRVRRVISSCLDDECREILRLRIVEGKTFGEIAKLMDLSQDQVRYRFEVSLGRLRSLLDQDDSSQTERE